MSDVLSEYKITPESDIDRNSLIERYKQFCEDEGLKFIGNKEEPAFYGLVYISIYVQTPDNEEGAEMLSKIEEQLGGDSEIQGWEMAMQTLQHDN